MLKSLRNKAPTADQRIAQHESGIIPDKCGGQRRRMGYENQTNQCRAND